MQARIIQLKPDHHISVAINSYRLFYLLALVSHIIVSYFLISWKKTPYMSIHFIGEIWSGIPQDYFLYHEVNGFFHIITLSDHEFLRYWIMDGIYFVFMLPIFVELSTNGEFSYGKAIGLSVITTILSPLHIYFFGFFIDFFGTFLIGAIVMGISLLIGSIMAVILTGVAIYIFPNHSLVGRFADFETSQWICSIFAIPGIIILEILLKLISQRKNKPDEFLFRSIKLKHDPTKFVIKQNQYNLPEMIAGTKTGHIYTLMLNIKNELESGVFFRGHVSEITGVAASDSLIFTGSKDGVVRCWDRLTYQLLNQIQLPGNCSDLVIVNKRLYVSFDNSGSFSSMAIIRHWDTQDFVKLPKNVVPKINPHFRLFQEVISGKQHSSRYIDSNEYRNHSHFILRMRSINNALLVTTQSSPRLRKKAHIPGRIYVYFEGQDRWEFRLPKRYAVFDVTYIDNYVIGACEDGKIRIFDSILNKLVDTLVTPSLTVNNIVSYSISKWDERIIYLIAISIGYSPRKVHLSVWQGVYDKLGAKVLDTNLDEFDSPNFERSVSSNNFFSYIGNTEITDKLTRIKDMLIHDDTLFLVGEKKKIYAINIENITDLID